MIQVAVDDTVNDGANAGVFIGDDVTYFVFRLCSQEHQIAFVKHRFHAVPVDDHIGCLPAHLQRHEQYPCQGHDDDADGGTQGFEMEEIV